MPGVESLAASQVQQALQLLGAGEDSAGRGSRARRLAEVLRSHGTVRTAVDRAPDAARGVFLRLAENGPAPVQDVLGRGWWGRGTLPPPLDWLQARALVTIDGDGILHAVDEAREGFLELTLELGPVGAARAGSAAVHAVATVVVAAPAVADRAAAVAGTGLTLVAPTVGVSSEPPALVAAALRAAGITLEEEAVVAASPSQPALPGTPEEAAGPRAIRVLLERAVAESRQVRLEYFPSSRAGAKTERTVDPWSFGDDVLRGYCHLRNGERSFAVDRIGKARLLPSPAEHRPG